MQLSSKVPGSVESSSTSQSSKKELSSKLLPPYYVRKLYSGTMNTVFSIAGYAVLFNCEQEPPSAPATKLLTGSRLDKKAGYTRCGFAIKHTTRASKSGRIKLCVATGVPPAALVYCPFFVHMLFKCSHRVMNQGSSGTSAERKNKIIGTHKKKFRYLTQILHVAIYADIITLEQLCSDKPADWAKMFVALLNVDTITTLVAKFAREVSDGEFNAQRAKYWLESLKFFKRWAERVLQSYSYWLDPDVQAASRHADTAIQEVNQLKSPTKRRRPPDGDQSLGPG
jgi:hypothetical protein